MRTIYLECDAGASGDMVMGALAGLLDDPSELEAMFERAAIPGVSVEVRRGYGGAVPGIGVRVKVDGEEERQGEAPHGHARRGLKDVLGVVGSLNVSDRVKADARAIYSTIADAESRVHGEPVDLVHFHEVGALDAVADVVGACMLMERLAPERVVCSPLRTGYGRVECAHGSMPVPAPATALVLEGMAAYSGDAEGEFTTPTGAAVVKRFATEYGRMPAMTVGKVGTGLGSRGSDRFPDVLRAFMGDSADELPRMTQIDCNIDDMTPEDLADVVSLLMSEGALDASVSPLLMKKGRPGFLLTCLCRDPDAERMARLILGGTSTIGVRCHGCERFELESRTETVATPYGDVRVKVSEGYGVRREKPEHDDLARLAAENGVGVDEVRRSVRRRRNLFASARG